jgi:hypothetical protein
MQVLKNIWKRKMDEEVKFSKAFWSKVDWHLKKKSYE